MDTIKGNCKHTPFQDFVLGLLAQNPNDLFTTGGLIEEYEERTGIKRKEHASQLAIKKLGERIKIARKEQLYYSYGVPPSGIAISMHSRNIAHRNVANAIHSTHKIKLSIGYQGTQPLEGADQVKPFGRYGTEKQAVFRYENLTIVAFKYKLHVWLHFPAGNRTEEQLDYAKRRGTLALVQFAKERNLALKLTNRNDLKLLKAHSVVEAQEVNEALSGTIKEYEKEIYEQIGTKICETSHKGKIEHEGLNRADRIIQGTDVAKGLEWLMLDFPQEFRRAEVIEDKYLNSISLYDIQIRKHLTAITEISETLKEMRTLIKQIGDRY